MADEMNYPIGFVLILRSSRLTCMVVRDRDSLTRTRGGELLTTLNLRVV